MLVWLSNTAAKNTRLLSFVDEQHPNIAAVRASSNTHKRSEQTDPRHPQCERGLWHQNQFVSVWLGQITTLVQKLHHSMAGQSNILFPCEVRCCLLHDKAYSTCWWKRSTSMLEKPYCISMAWWDHGMVEVRLWGLWCNWFVKPCPVLSPPIHTWPAAAETAQPFDCYLWKITNSIGQHCHVPSYVWKQLSIVLGLFEKYLQRTCKGPLTIFLGIFSKALDVEAKASGPVYTCNFLFFKVLEKRNR